VKHPKALEFVAVETLIPYARNSRTHSDAQIAQIAASIKEFGFTNPILIDSEETVIAGHGRLLAARKLGLDEVPCLRLDHLSKAQARALVIADNKIALNAGWDDELLRVELLDLDSEGFRMEVLGFDLSELERAMGLVTDVKEPESPDDFRDVDEQDLGHKCPRCGFEYDE
jgi:ParB-like chromosome segregation protein Spo0J